MVKWQAGVEYFNQGYDQDAVNTLSAFVLSPQVGFPVAMHSPQVVDRHQPASACSARATFTFNDKADLTAGLRFDHESSDAHLNTFFEPAIAPANVVAAEQSFDDVSPQFAFGYRVRPRAHRLRVGGARLQGGRLQSGGAARQRGLRRRARVARRGRRASRRWPAARSSANAAVFFIDWDDLQLNVPNPFVPGQFYIANVGSARSRGVEFDVTARPRPAIDLFAAVGFTSARVRGRHDGERRRRRRQRAALHAGLHGDVRRPVDARHHVGDQRLRARGDRADRRVRLRRRQHAKARTRIRSSISAPAPAHKRLFAELWLRNAFETRYVPIAIPYPGFAPSGFIGENGRPRTFGVSVGTTF